MSGSSYGRRLTSVFNQPIVDRFQTRSRRRLIVTVTCGLVVTTILTAAVGPSLWWAWGPMCAAFFPLAAMLNMSVRGVTEIPLDHLDERFGRLRTRAFHDAYYLGVVSAAALGAGLVAAAPLGFSVAAIAGSGVGFVMGLPALLTAWRLPDEADEAA